MIRQNLHTHTVFDDGTATPMAMAQAALDAGLESLGFSAHSTLPYRDNCEIKPGQMPAYLVAVREAKEAFRGRLSVYNGLEWDSTCVLPDIEFDYIIGSIHHIVKDGQYLSIDFKPQVTRDILDIHFRGDKTAMLEAYFAQYEPVAQTPRVDIVGHFDLISKFDQVAHLFDGGDASYRDCAMAAMEKLLAADKIFEVNTGAMSRGYRTAPYPAIPLLKAFREMGFGAVITSDCHDGRYLDHYFAESAELLKACGFKEKYVLTEEGFVPAQL